MEGEDGEQTDYRAAWDQMSERGSLLLLTQSRIHDDRNVHRALKVRTLDKQVTQEPQSKAIDTVQCERACFMQFLVDQFTLSLCEYGVWQQG